MYTGRLLEGKRKIIYLGVIFCCKELGLSNNNALRSHFYLMFLVSFYIFSFLLLKLHWKRRQGRHFFPFFQVIKLRCGEAKTPRIWVLEPWFYNVYNPGLLLPGQCREVAELTTRVLVHRGGGLCTHIRWGCDWCPGRFIHSTFHKHIEHCIVLGKTDTPLPPWKLHSMRRWTTNETSKYIS